MVKYIAKPNYNVSVAGKLVKFNALGFAYINKEEVMKELDKLPNVKKDMPAPKLKVEAPLPKEESKPAPKKKKKK